MTDNSNTCVIFAAGEYYSDTPIVPSGAFIIAADGGLDHARALDMSPDVVVGDFDSLTGERPTQGEHTIALPPEKRRSRPSVGTKKSAGHTMRGFSIYMARSADESITPYPISN